MNFKEWLLSEMGDILARDTSNIVLTPISQGGYYYKFNHGDEWYTVMMTPPNLEKHHIEWPWPTFDRTNFYEIAFSRGPQNSYKLTGKAGTGANNVYTQVLLAIKKLFETTQVDGLYFSPADSAMSLVYRRFFQQYLSKDFMQIDSFNYVRKDKIRKMLKGQSPIMKQVAYKSFINTNRRQIEKNRENRESQKLYRNYRIAAEKLKGQFVYNRNNEVSFLAKVEPKSIALLTFNDNYIWYNHDTDYINLNTKETPSQEEIMMFLKALVRSQNMPDVRRFLSEPEAAPLIEKAKAAGFDIQLNKDVKPRPRRVFEDDIDF